MSSDPGNQRDDQNDLDDQEGTSDQEQETNDFTLEAFYEDAKTRIRFVAHKGEPWYSIVDVIGLLTDAPKPKTYWGMMKQRIQDEGFREAFTKCEPLKMLAADGKMRLTDAANEETLLRITESIPSPKAEPFKQWLARVGHERLEEMRNPELGADRMRKQYERLGYSDEWIGLRLQGIMVRDELTNEWHMRGATEGKQKAALTETIQTRGLGIATAEHRQVKDLPSHAVLRDSYNPMEMIITAFGEQTAIGLHQQNDSQGIAQLQADAREAGAAAGKARQLYEETTGLPVVSSENYKTLRQARQRELQPPLFPDEEDTQSGGLGSDS